MLTDAVASIGLHSHTHSFSLSVSPLPCLSLFHLKGAATPQTGSFEIQISLYPVLIISKVTPTQNYIVQNMSQSGSRILDPVFRGGGPASPKGKQIF